MRIAATARIPATECSGGKTGGDGSVVTMIPTARLNEVLLQVQLSSRVTAPMQIELSIELDFLGERDGIEMFEFVRIVQTLLERTAHMIQLQVADGLFGTGIGLNALELLLEIGVIFRGE